MPNSIISQIGVTFFVDLLATGLTAAVPVVLVEAGFAPLAFVGDNGTTEFSFLAEGFEAAAVTTAEVTGTVAAAAATATATLEAVSCTGTVSTLVSVLSEVAVATGVSTDSFAVGAFLTLDRPPASKLSGQHISISVYTSDDNFSKVHILSTGWVSPPAPTAAGNAQGQGMGSAHIFNLART